MAYVRTFGQIPDNPEGTAYKSREDLRRAGMHAHNQAGISGTGNDGADAIVLNGGYPDDSDDGDSIIYTGHGGQKGKRQVADQTMSDPGNAGLVRSHLDDLPVRVIRGYEEPSIHAPKEGYRYDGLYRVANYWFKTRPDGFRVLQFLLLKIGSPFDRPDLVVTVHAPKAAELVGPAGRAQTLVDRIIRRPEVVRNIKRWHQNKCQVCDLAVKLPGGLASEVAHIQPLGKPHNGPDIEENALCLCPNDHRRFDNGAIYLTDALIVMDALTGSAIGPLRQYKSHHIGLEYVKYHRRCWHKGI